MDNKIKRDLIFKLSDYIGEFAIMDALLPGMISPHHVQSFLDAETTLIGSIEAAKALFETDEKTDKNLYGLIVGAESTIKAANDSIKSDSKAYCFQLVKR